MRKATKRIFSQSKTPGELQHWSLAKEQIGYKLKRYYQAYTTEELPPQLLALIKKLACRPETKTRPLLRPKEKTAWHAR
jgi:hypothetical protein